MVNVRCVGAHALLVDVDEPPGRHAEPVRRRESGELTARDVVPGPGVPRTVPVDGVPDPGAPMPGARARFTS